MIGHSGIAAGALLLALAGGIAAPGTGQADTLIDATDPSAVLNIMRGYASAEMETDSEGMPMITGRIDGTKYTLFFFGCDENRLNCTNIQFYSGWLKEDDVYSIEEVNRWNANKRFGRAYLDDAKDPVIEMDINLHGKVTVANLEDTIEYWVIVLKSFRDEVVRK